jgi:protein-S-isoprenylcysteine O-methyltransferase Ste14
MVISGLDCRYNGTGLWPLSIQVVALALVILAMVFIIRATVSNPFFSAVIRIQNDRRHFVIVAGPYRYIRHSGYAGFILYILSMPLMLGSSWALIPAIISTGLYILTDLEDLTLQYELLGYRDYALHVPYRFIPRV